MPQHRPPGRPGSCHQLPCSLLLPAWVQAAHLALVGGTGASDPVVRALLAAGVHCCHPQYLVEYLAHPWQVRAQRVAVRVGTSGSSSRATRAVPRHHGPRGTAGQLPAAIGPVALTWHARHPCVHLLLYGPAGPELPRAVWQLLPAGLGAGLHGGGQGAGCGFGGRVQQPGAQRIAVKLLRPDNCYAGWDRRIVCGLVTARANCARPDSRSAHERRWLAPAPLSAALWSTWVLARCRAGAPRNAGCKHVRRMHAMRSQAPARVAVRPHASPPARQHVHGLLRVA